MSSSLSAATHRQLLPDETLHSGLGAMSSLLNKVGVKALRHGPSIDGLKAFGVGGSGGGGGTGRDALPNGHTSDQHPFAGGSTSRLQNSSSAETLGPAPPDRRAPADPQPSADSRHHHQHQHHPSLSQSAAAATTATSAVQSSTMPPPSLAPASSSQPLLSPPPLAAGDGSSPSSSGPSSSSHYLQPSNSHFTESSLPSPSSSTFSSLTGSTNATSFMGNQSAGQPHPSTHPQAPPPEPSIVHPGVAAVAAQVSSSVPRLPDVGTRSYTILREIGDGSFGTVWLADWHSPLSLPPGVPPPAPSARAEYKGKKLVAVKKMKKVFEGGWDECMNLKELRSLRMIPMNPNIIPLFDAFLHPQGRELYFVFEWMEGNLYQLTKTRKGRPLAGGLVASIFRQVLLGLHHIHSNGHFHRDMKPENLLITTTGVIDYPHGSPFALPTAPPEKDVEVVVKIADFGLARETASRPPYTEYVSTRWYRAPEVLLRSRVYSNPVDMWALGAIMAETVTLRPLFPGSSEMDQVNKICDILGDPKNAYGVDDKGRLRGGGQWNGGVALADSVGFRFPDKRPIDFMRLFDLTNVPIQLVDIIHEMLLYDPAARLTTHQAVTHAYFLEVEPRLRAFKYRTQPSLPAFYQGPITPSGSSDGGVPRHLLQPGAGGNPLSPPQSARMDLDGTMPPRSMPSSHAHGLLAQVKPAFGGPRPSLAPSGDADGDSIMTDDQSGYSVPLTGPYPSGAASASDHYLAAAGAPYAHGGAGYDSTYSLPVNVSSPTDSTVSPNPSFRSGLGLAPLSPDPVAVAPSAKPRGRGLSSLFHSNHPAAATSASLKRSPSDRSGYEGSLMAAPADEVGGGGGGVVDPKKAKKEAEKIAKEQAKAKRERLRLEAQARARAVMLKQQRMAQAGATDLVINAEFATPNNAASRRAAGAGDPAPVVGAAAAAVAKGKARAVGTPSLPQIVEDSSHLRPVDATRFRSRRRGDEDADVHSVSSNETGDDGASRRFSMVSANTMDSDPGPYRPSRAAPPGYAHLTRSPSHSSLGSASASRLSVASSPNLAAAYRLPTAASTTSSLDSQLINNMASLTAGAGAAPSPGPPRVRSPSEPRYNPYPRPTLPGIEAFDFPPGSFPTTTNNNPGAVSGGPGGIHDRHFSMSSSAASIMSSQSVPISISHQSSSYHHHHHSLGGGGGGGGRPAAPPSTSTGAVRPHGHHSGPSSPLADPDLAVASGMDDAMQEE